MPKRARKISSRDTTIAVVARSNARRNPPATSICGYSGSAAAVLPALHDTERMLDDLLVRIFGWRAHVAFGDPPQSDRWRWLSRHLQHGPVQTLDAGSGSGAIAIYAASIGNQVLGLSDNEVQNERAQRRAELLDVPARFAVADLRGPDVLDGTGPYDQIICSEVIEHVIDDRGLLQRLGE